MTVRAITFDFWGTLFRDRENGPRHRFRVEALAQTLGLDPEIVHPALEAAHQTFFQVHVAEQRTLGPMDAVRITCDTLGVTPSGQQAEALSEAFGSAILHYPPTPVEDALAAVRAAARRGPVALISDSGISPGASLRKLLEKNGFTEYLHVLTFSDEVGVSKPQRPMFEVTATALEVAPEELLHIGDLEPTDIDGARGVGAKGALFAGVNPRFVESTQADYVFHTWAEFMALLPGICSGS